MELSCEAAPDYIEMKKTIQANQESTDLFLIDTIGRNPRDMLLLGEMKEILNACGSLAEVHLALSAGTKSSDLKEILQHFEPFNYKSVIITKMDETQRCGNVIGALAEKSKAISYVTNGQNVPDDIERASVMQFLLNLEGFSPDKIKLEEKFPQAERGTLQNWR
jgi:flagellar biosynthesis protein FlhF